MEQREKKAKEKQRKVKGLTKLCAQVSGNTKEKQTIALLLLFVRLVVFVCLIGCCELFTQLTYLPTYLHTSIPAYLSSH